MFDTKHPDFLRRVLIADAAACVACGGVMCLGAQLLERLGGIPAALSFAAGGALFPIAAVIAFAATRVAPPVGLVRTIVIGNTAWVGASLWLALAGNLALTPFGLAFILAQAGAVATLTVLEQKGLRDLSDRESADANVRA